MARSPLCEHRGEDILVVESRYRAVKWESVFGCYRERIRRAEPAGATGHLSGRDLSSLRPESR